MIYGMSLDLSEIKLIDPLHTPMPQLTSQVLADNNFSCYLLETLKYNLQISISFCTNFCFFMHII